MRTKKGAECNSMLCVALRDDECEAVRRTHSGAHLINTPDCKGALAALEHEPAQVVISAERLPDGSWRDVVARSQELAMPPAVVVASLHADERMWAEALNLGAYDLILLPFEALELRRVLDAARRYFARSGSWRYKCTANA